MISIVPSIIVKCGQVFDSLWIPLLLLPCRMQQGYPDAVAGDYGMSINGMISMVPSIMVKCGQVFDSL